MAGWPQGGAWGGFVDRWQAACAEDAVLAEWRQGADIRQMDGVAGEAWGAERANDKIVRIEYGL